MVSESVFEGFEKRVVKLKAGDPENPKLIWCQQEIQRLDAANSPLCFKGFKKTDVPKRRVN